MYCVGVVAWPLYLYAQHEVTVGMLQPPLSALQLLSSLLLPLELPDVVDRGLQNGALIPAHVPEAYKGTNVSSQSRLSS